MLTEDGTKTDFHVFFVNSPSLISGVTVVFKKKLKIDFTSSIFLWQRHGTEKRESFVSKGERFLQQQNALQSGRSYCNSHLFTLALMGKKQMTVLGVTELHDLHNNMTDSS